MADIEALDREIIKLTAIYASGMEGSLSPQSALVWANAIRGLKEVAEARQKYEIRLAEIEILRLKDQEYERRIFFVLCFFMLPGAVLYSFGAIMKWLLT